MTQTIPNIVDYDCNRIATLKGRGVLPARAYISPLDTPRRMTTLTYPRKGYEQGEAYLRSRDNDETERPEQFDYSFARKFVSHGSQGRHVIFVKDFPPTGKGVTSIGNGYRIGNDDVPKGSRGLKIDIGNDLAVIQGTKAANEYLAVIGYQPLTAASQVIVLYNDGLTVNGKPRIFEAICAITATNGNYFLTPVQTVEHGPWQYGGTHRTIETQYRCHRILIYRDCSFTDTDLNLGQLIYVLRYGTGGPVLQDKFEPYNFHFPFIAKNIDHTDLCDNYADAIPDPNMIQNAVLSEETFTGNFPQRLRAIYPDDDYAALLAWDEFTSGMTGNPTTLHFDMLFEAWVYRYVIRKLIVEFVGNGKWEEIEWVTESTGYLGTTGKAHFIF
jgi:hypothetical protein